MKLWEEKNNKTWQNLNKEEYDLCFQIRKDFSLLIFLDTQQLHYRQIINNQQLQAETSTWSSIDQIVQNAHKFKVKLEEGILEFHTQVYDKQELRTKQMKTYIHLEKPTQQIANIDWRIRQIQRQNQEIRKKIAAIETGAQERINSDNQYQKQFQKFREGMKSQISKFQKTLNSLVRQEDMINEESTMTNGKQLAFQSNKEGNYFDEAPWENLEKRVQLLEQDIRVMNEQIEQQVLSKFCKLQADFKNKFILEAKKMTSSEKVERMREQIRETQIKISQLVRRLPILESSQVKKLLEREKQRQAKDRKLAQQQKKQENRLRAIVQKSKEDPASLVDVGTKWASSYQVEGNKLELQSVKGGYKPIFLDIEIEGIVTFIAHVRSTKNGCIMIGVVDKIKQRQKREFYDSGNAICFWDHRIYYGMNNTYKWKEVGITLEQGMEIEVKVDRSTSTVVFTLNNIVHEIKSDILSQPNRKFCPYFEMVNAQDSVEWSLL